MGNRGTRLLAKLYSEFFLGGIIYLGIEFVFRAAVGHKQTHPLVIILGGAAYLIGVGVCRIPAGKHYFWVKPILGGVLITAWEFVFGLFFNVFLGYDIWSYSGSRYTLLGQVCLEFFFIWIGMMIIIEIVDYVFENKILANGPYSFRALSKHKTEGRYGR